VSPGRLVEPADPEVKAALAELIARAPLDPATAWAIASLADLEAAELAEDLTALSA
jgi:hypothetical protein